MKELKFQNFLKVLKDRKQRILHSEEKTRTHVLKGNVISEILHPKKQIGIIKRIVNETDTIKSITFVPSNNNSKKQFAPFQAGQYVSLVYKKEGVVTRRPYSICSSPSNRGELEIAIRKIDNGLTSTIAHDELKVGDEVEFSAPAGLFYPESIRDSKNLVGIAGGSGITPFVSMARAISDGVFDFQLTLFYGARKKEDLAYFLELEKITKACEKIKVIYVLSEEDSEFEHGFISNEILDKYLIKDEDYSFFVCGPTGLYNFITSELAKRGVKRSRIRFEVSGERITIDSYLGYPEELPNEVKFTVHIQDEVRIFMGDPKISILRNLENHGIIAVSSCRSGECGLCHSHLISGDVFIPKENDHLRAADRIYNQIHICSTFAKTDIELEIPKG